MSDIYHVLINRRARYITDAAKRDCLMIGEGATPAQLEVAARDTIHEFYSGMLLIVDDVWHKSDIEMLERLRVYAYLRCSK